MPFVASVIAHAAVIAALPGRAAASAGSDPPPDVRVEAPEPVEMEPAAPAETEEATEQTGEPAAPLDDEARGAGWAGAGRVPVGPLDSRDGYDAIRAQISGWSPRLVTGTYVPRGPRIAHPDEMPSRRVPAAVIAGVVRANATRFRVCQGAGLPQSATISGQVLVTFVIEPDGHVSGARDAGGRFPDEAVRRCIVRAVAQLSFAKPPLGVAQEATVPIALSAEEAIARPDLRDSHGE